MKMILRFLPLFLTPAMAKSAARASLDHHPAAEAPVHGPALSGGIISPEKAQRMAEFFSVLGDPNRWRILSALAIAPQRVSDLASQVEMSESAVSHQLRVLRTMRLVGYQRQGRNVIYRLKDHHILNLYRDVSDHLDEPDDGP